MRTIAILFLSTYVCHAQLSVFKATEVANPFEMELQQQFSTLKTYQATDASLGQIVQTADFDYTLSLELGEDLRWDFELYPVDMYTENASIRVLTESGEMLHPVPRNISFRGQVRGDNRQQVSFIIHGDYLYGHISEGNNRTYITSVNKYIAGAPADLYMIFEEQAMVNQFEGEATCGLDTYPEFDSREGHDHPHSGARMVTGNCYELDLGIASDHSMYTDRGSTVQGVIDHVLSVMMDVETDYTTLDIDDALEFEIVEQVVSTCSFCDVWTSSTSASELLTEFSSWSNAGGFNTTVDMGQLWTDRDFDGTTVGLAYTATGLLCNNAYHVLQDFTTNAANLRVMTSHEIGHNLSAVHDGSGSGHIMAPSVSSSTTWSAASLASIDPVIDDGFSDGCLIACAATPCDPVTDVSITSINASGFTISWTATTEGNYRLQVIDEEDFSVIHTVALTSSASMTINPAGWEICHQYKVMVENDCGSSSYSAPVSALVADVDQGCAEFSSDTSLGWGPQTVNFMDASSNATSWSWTFGDGNSSTDQNPSNTYNSPGVYEVSLTVNAGAHSITKSDYIFVLPTGVTLPYTTSDGGNMDDNDFGTISLTADKTSVLEKGVPSNFFTNTSNCWVTNLDGDITDETNESTLNSPSFDFTGITSATLSFDLGMEVQFCNGPFAVQVQYSTNDGATWTRLGADTDANWYNRGPAQGCQVNAGIFADEMGWTEISSGGTTYSYNVDALAGNSSVIFRMNFSVLTGFSGGYDRAGMMVDNFAISATLLPVELNSFTGRLDQSEVELFWKTDTETNNDYFIIEKSADGRNFKELAMVQGAGTNFSPKDYVFIDEQPFLGTNYYRLSQYDFDGNYKVFEDLVLVDYAADQNIVAVQPNPTQGDQIQLIYLMDRAGALQVDIFNSAGKRVKTIQLEALEARNVFEISLEGLSEGVYFMKTRHRYQIESLRFVKLN